MWEAAEAMESGRVSSKSGTRTVNGFDTTVGILHYSKTGTHIPDYEEYHACAMKIVKIIVDKTQKLKEGSLIEINYHNYPQCIKDLQGNIL